MWRSYPGEETIDGPHLAQRAFHYGWAGYSIQWFLDSKVGDALNTGVSAYERIE
jgi:hypothetical protein